MENPDLIPSVVIGREVDAPVEEIFSDTVRTVREYLHMDVAFISEFSEGRRIFRYVDSALTKSPVMPGDSGPLDESYCQRVVDGRLPELIHDASLLPAALELPVTKEQPIGSHLSVPIRLSDGSIYGTFCCFNSTPDLSLTERDITMMRIFGEFIGRHIERQLEAQRTRRETTERVNATISAGAFSIVYQPVYHFGMEAIVGFEALTRFSATPHRSPDVWFNEAAQVGLGERMEIAVIKKALLGLAELPSDTYVSLNVSPENILSGAVAKVLDGVPPDRVVLEITEHVSIQDYSLLEAALRSLRASGLLLAIDDAGAGYASFRHILKLDPDIIKLDISLTRGIDTDAKRRALAAALIRFAEETGAQIIAEGVETALELATLRALKVDKAQGYLIGRPMPLASASALFRTSPSDSCEC